MPINRAYSGFYKAEWESRRIEFDGKLVNISLILMKFKKTKVEYL
jgi:hypothetical protein